jgi:redox-sensitive bicupin YhaK (pirin superfamily)
MDAIQAVIHGRERDLGDNFHVRRVLPSMQRRLVGPFIFFDHFGPVDLPPGHGMDVRPHPHISLATVTYLYEGEIFHRDSLGNAQAIKPGDVNWMTAGRGIVHSERSSDEVRARGQRMHGLQTWVALPLGSEEVEPAFVHHAAETLPQIDGEGFTARVIVGSAMGKTSPVATLSPTLYVDVQLEDGAELEVPEAEERALYVTVGALAIGDEQFEVGTMVLIQPESVVRVRGVGKTRVMIAGGAKLTGERHIYWNFVASSQERIEKAKRDWQEGRFPKVPGDEIEFIPLPE